MDRDALLAHLRDAHGHADMEPGGANHVPGSYGWVESLDGQTLAGLRTIHGEDHSDGREWGHEHAPGE